MASVVYPTHVPCYVHTGISTMMMGTVIAARMQNVMDVLNAMHNNDSLVDPDLFFNVIAYAMQQTKRDLSNFIHMESMWNMSKNTPYHDIHIFIQLLERRAKIHDISGLRWCVQQIIDTLAKTSKAMF